MSANWRRRAGGGGKTDPNFANVSLLLHMDGTNASTTFTDSSSHGFTMTVTGNTQLTTTSPKFGSACGTFDGTGDYLNTATDASAFDFGSSDFTVEGWVKSSGTAGENFIESEIAQGSTGWWGIFLNWNDGSSSSGAISVWGDNGAIQRIIATGTGWNNGAWHHIALTRQGNSVKLFLDGTQIGSTYTASSTWGAASTGLLIGIAESDHASRPFNGQMDEIRVTKGVARYTANFTAPTEAFPSN